MNPRAIRITLGILLFASVLYFPWYVTLLIALIIVARTSGYEVLIAGLCVDLLYGDRGIWGLEVPFLATGTAVILFFAAHFIKKNFIR